MAQKYQNRKMKIAEALSQNPVRDLIVVDDRLIRQKYFSEAQDIIERIETLERKIQLFHSSDQKRFDDWYKLTFREDQVSVERAQQEFRQLAEFHNWVVATARMLDIELGDALLLMKEEERRYQIGSREERERIELDRKKRNAYIENDSNPKYDEEARFSREDREDYNQLDALLERIEGILLPQEHEILSSPDERLQRISEIEPEMMELALQDQETSFLLFHLGISWGERQEDYTFFLSMWKLFSREQKIFFADVYESITGQSLKLLLNRIAKGEDLDFDRDSEKGDSEDEEDNSNSFREDFFGRKGSAKKSAKPDFDPEEEEGFKQLYRKLVRKLHPDTHGNEKPQNWMKRFWQSVQDAYKMKDVKTLDRLLKLTLLRTNSLNQLTIDEIGQAKGWLKKDLSNLQNEQGQLKKSMAWGFSERKDYSGLTRKIRKEFEVNLNAVLFEIRKLKLEHQMLEAMASGQLSENERVFKKRGSRNQSRRRRRPARHRFHEDDQDNFSF